MPFDDDEDYHSIYHREGRVRKAGNDVVTATTSRSVITDNNLWAAKASWTPQDDLNYALDDDGAGYDDAVEAEVMEDEGIIKKYPRSRVSVSTASWFLSFRWPDKFLSVETSPSGLEGSPSLFLSG